MSSEGGSSGRTYVHMNVFHCLGVQNSPLYLCQTFNLYHMGMGNKTHKIRGYQQDFKGLMKRYCNAQSAGSCVSSDRRSIKIMLRQENFNAQW